MTSAPSLPLAADVDLGTVARALAFSARKHRDQRRKDHAASPYINHPIALFSVLVSVGVRDAAALSGALLHDTIEDTETTYEELVAEFGSEIADIVMEVTDDKDLPKAERKRLQIVHAPSLTEKAKLVKMADKISNITDIADSPPVNWPLARRQTYFDWAKEVVDGLGEVHPQLRAVFDAAYTRRPTV